MQQYLYSIIKKNVWKVLLVPTFQVFLDQGLANLSP